MALSDVDYKVTLTAILDGNTDNPIENVFWYKADNPAGSAPGLATAFANEIVPALASLVTSSLLFVSAEVINLVDLQDFTIASFGVPGERASGIANRWDAWAFQYLRPIRGMNNGSKRIGPIAKADYDDQQPNSGFLVTLDLVSDQLESSIPAAGLTHYQPCCVKTVKVPNENGNGKFHYEPDTLFICNSVAFQRVSHQESRGS